MFLPGPSVAAIATTISTLRCMGARMAAATKAIVNKLVTARIIALDETTTRTNGIAHWQWVLLSDKALLLKQIKA